MMYEKFELAVNKEIIFYNYIKRISIYAISHTRTYDFRLASVDVLVSSKRTIQSSDS